MKDKRVGILMGGLSAEARVSIASGEAIFAALTERGYDAVRVFVDRDIDQVLRQEPIDVAFIALHGTYGEDGCIQGLLELLDIPYTGSGLTESALAMDKQKSKELFRLHNVPTPPYYTLHEDELPQLREIHGPFGFPAFVKPRRQGSSVGAGRADDVAELQQRCEEGFRFDRCLLVERYVRGREVAVGVLDGKALGAVEIEPRNAAFYDYRAKYAAGQSDYHLPPRLSSTRYQNVLRIAERAVRALGVEGATRVDMLVTEGDNEYVLEANTLPGMTQTSLLPKVAAHAGYAFADLCEAILSRAELRTGRAPSEVATDSSAGAPLTDVSLVAAER